jgi:hypothetical protein
MHYPQFDHKQKNRNFLERMGNACGVPTGVKLELNHVLGSAAPAEGSCPPPVGEKRKMYSSVLLAWKMKVKLFLTMLVNTRSNKR